MINIKKIAEDFRGKVFVLEKDGKEFSHFMILKAGMSRGGHIHDRQEIITVLDGKISYSTINAKFKGKETKGELEAAEQLTVEPGFAHIITAEEDSLVLGNLENCTTIKYEPYRSIVDAKK